MASSRSVVKRVESTDRRGYRGNGKAEIIGRFTVAASSSEAEGADDLL